MQTTTNYALKKPEDNEVFDQQNHANWNMDQIDMQMKRVDDKANNSLQVGENNKTTQEVKTLFIDTDTRRVEVTRTDGQVASITIKDPSDNSTVETVTINRTDGQVSSLTKSVGGRTVTYTVNRTSGQITGITKAVV